MSEFLRLVEDEAEDVRALGHTLKNGYRYKELADYSVDPSIVITDRAAADMIEAATCFVERVIALLRA